MNPGDRDLLRRFVQDADEEAFASIVHRYHGLVMSVCRRVTCRSADAEDSFQATFLALARRPRSIRRAVSLSSWLYTVAWRMSMRLVRQRRTQPMETLPMEPENRKPGPLDQIAASQNLMVLDEELNQLPSKYRDVLVMNYFADLSNQQIADQLDVSRGTVDGRLRRGRNLLRVRLARRGVSLGVLAVAAGLSGEVVAATSPELLSATTQLGIQTLSNTVPGTTDLSQLEPLVRPETVLMSSKLVMTGVVCVSLVIGTMGLHGLNVSVAEDGIADLTSELSDEQAIAAEGNRSTRAVFVSQPTSHSGDSAVSADETDRVDSEDVGSFIGGGGQQRIDLWPADAQPVEQWMYEVLDQPVPPVGFSGETPLSDILEFLARRFTEKYGQSEDESFVMTVWADLPALQRQSIDSLDDVMVRDIELDGITLRNALKAILGQTSDPPLTAVIQNEVLLITTVDQADSELTTRVYPVDGLLPANSTTLGRSTGPFGYAGVHQPTGHETLAAGTSDDGNEVVRKTSAEHLLEVVQQMTSPGQWDVSGGEGAVSIFGESLVVRQTWHGHQEIVRLLNLLHDRME